MTALLKLLPLLLVMSALRPTGGAAAREQAPAARRHALAIVHPGDEKAVPIQTTLEQLFDAQGNPSGYRMWVDSVICREERCDVVDVELSWDALGRYQRYRVEEGAELTKLHHEPFTEADYAKLQRILLDPQSPLREVEKSSMTRDRAADAVDGVVGATALTLKSTVVLGAGYTCYDLWHWANALVRDSMRDLSGKHSHVAKLLEYLHDEDPDTVLFALEHLRRREAFAPEAYRAVLDRVKAGRATYVKPALRYLQAAATEDAVYDAAICELFNAGTSEHRVLILTALAADPRARPQDFFDALSAALPQMETYYEVHLLLKLFEERHAASRTVASHALGLLDHEKFFIARRAYWYLRKHGGAAAANARLDAFAEAHAGKLGPAL